MSRNDFIAYTTEPPEELKFPSLTLRIGPYDYSLRYIDAVQHDAAEAIGHHSEIYRVIQVATSLDRFSMIQTMLHEINHALLDIMGLTKKKSSEDLCDRLATGWLMVYRDNPWFLRWVHKLSTEEEL